MQRGSLDDLAALVAVARERSFTKAAAKLGVSQSALSQTIRQLETRLGIRLLTRTTRSVGLTEAGERLLGTVAPRLEEIEAELAAVSELGERPSGTIRITAGDHAIRSILWPKLESFLPRYPEIRVELAIDYELTDIVAGRYDAGVRLGEQVAKDMIAVRIGPDIRFAVVGAPAYLAGRPRPQAPQDLVGHRCINLRLPTYGGLYAWEFERDGREVKVRVEGQLVFNGIFQVLDAALAGFGLAYVPEDLARPHLAAGARRLVAALVGLPPVLSQPAPDLRRLRPADGRAAPPRLISPNHEINRHPGRGAARGDALQNRDLFEGGNEIPCLRSGTLRRSADTG